MARSGSLIPAPEDGDHYRVFGLLVIRGAFDPRPLAEESIGADERGGGLRRQWRLDFLLDPATAEAERHTRAYFADIYPADWNGGYDVDRYPSYGPDWRRSGPRAAQRLEELGVYRLADAQEAYSRSRQ
ncbi:hypothetical protein [Microbulbifer sp.]|uniref:hypothetical protein n=1 Tax=Microbulbifer sp. TaxID=1908541 RepID=UPI003F3591FB